LKNARVFQSRGHPLVGNQRNKGANGEKNEKCADGDKKGLSQRPCYDGECYGNQEQQTETNLHAEQTGEVRGYGEAGSTEEEQLGDKDRQVDENDEKEQLCGKQAGPFVRARDPELAIAHE
jgi:hypothetical protein